MPTPGIRRLNGRKPSAPFRLEGFRDICKDAFANYSRNGSPNQAAAIALYALLSIVPLFVLSVLAAGRFLGGTGEIQDQIIGIVRSFHPYFDGDLLAQLGGIDAKIKLLGWLGTLSLVWFSSMIFGAVETALNIAFRSEGRRNYFMSKLLAFSMIPLGWVTGLASVLLTYVTTLLSSQVSFVRGHVLDLHAATRFVLQYVVPFLASVLFVTILFKVIPARRIAWRTALGGGCLFSALVEVVKHAFTWYVAHHTRYNAIFGSLETVVILVVWVYYVAVILLFCAELMSSYERRDLLLIERVLMERDSGANQHRRLFRKFGRTFPAGSVLFQEGDASGEMYCLLEGRVRLEKRSGPAGKTLAELEPGTYFGEMAALTGVPRTASAIALTDCEAAVIDGHVFHRLLRESDDLAIHLLKDFSGRIQRTNEALDELTQSWVRLVILLHLAEAWPGSGDRNLLHELAERTGQTPEEVQGILASLADRGVLELRDGLILAFDRDWARRLLQELADSHAGFARA